MGPGFTNTEAFVDQDLSDLRKTRTYQPGEYWLIWADWTRKYLQAVPGWDGDAHSEEGWVEKTEADFNTRYADKDAVMHIVQSCGSEPRDFTPMKSWREVFGVEEAQ